MRVVQCCGLARPNRPSIPLGLSTNHHHDHHNYQLYAEAEKRASEPAEVIESSEFPPGFVFVHGKLRKVREATSGPCLRSLHESGRGMSGRKRPPSVSAGM